MAVARRAKHKFLPTMDQRADICVNVLPSNSYKSAAGRRKIRVFFCKMARKHA